MTIEELRDLIKNLPDDMEVGGCGHYGEFLECYDARVSTVRKSYFHSINGDKEEINIFLIAIESPGEEPD